MNTPFEEIVRELGATLGITLHLDHNGACCLQMNEKLRVQIEQDTKEDRVVLAAFISELSPGKFREEVLKECLKANAQFTIAGNPGAILGFCAHRNKLSCHTYVPFQELTGEKLVSTLTYLVEYALSWMEALQNGRTAPIGMQTRSTSPLPSPFGIRP